MRISRLHLEQFRNIESLSVFPCETVNIIYGDNAQGKTNLLEAIWLLSGAKSFRGAKDADLIRFGESRALIESDFFCAGRQQTSKIQLEGKKTAWLNDIRQDSITAFAGIFTTVVFSPSHLGLVKDGPAGRRKFLDTSICQITPRYIGMIGQYQRILLQRNTLLKDISYASALLDTLDIWDMQLAAYGTKVLDRRKEFVRQVNEIISEIHFRLTGGKERLSLTYESSIGEMSMEQALKKNRERDLRMKSTSVGPHRDDLCFLSGDLDIRKFGSQGQQRTAALSLKLAEIELVKRIIGDTPILLLDDVLSELDKNRQNYLLDSIHDIQTVITCTGLDEFVNHRFSINKIFHVKSGHVAKEN